MTDTDLELVMRKDALHAEQQGKLERAKQLREQKRPNTKASVASAEA